MINGLIFRLNLVCLQQSIIFGVKLHKNLINNRQIFIKFAVGKLYLVESRKS